MRQQKMFRVPKFTALKPSASFGTCILRHLVPKVILLFLLTSGCTSPDLSSEGAAGAILSNSEAISQAKSAFPALKPDTQLNALAVDLNEVAIRQSSALQQVYAEQANLIASRYLLYPQIQPSISVPLVEGGIIGASLNLEQVVWDGGRSGAHIQSAELKVRDAFLTVWEEQNQTVYDGLSAFGDAVKFQEQNRISSMLLVELGNIQVQAKARADSGYSDRGELLRIEGYISEVRRQILSDTSELERARAKLQSLLEKSIIGDSLGIVELSGMCQRSRPDFHAPSLVRMELRIEEARIRERITQARMFPQLILQAGYGIDSNGIGEPTVGLLLDASDILGLGRRNNAEAARTSVVAAERNLQIRRRDLAQEMAVLEQDYKGVLTELQQLDILKNNSRDTIDLFHEQLVAGSISVVDGVSFHQEVAQIERAIIDAHHAILLNCLQSARLRGALVAFKDNYHD